MPDPSCPHYKFLYWDAQISQMGDANCTLTAKPEYLFGARTGGVEYLLCDRSDHAHCPLYHANLATPVDDAVNAAIKARGQQMILPGLEQRTRFDQPLAGLDALEIYCAGLAKK